MKIDHNYISYSATQAKLLHDINHKGAILENHTRLHKLSGSSNLIVAKIVSFSTGTLQDAHNWQRFKLYLSVKS